MVANSIKRREFDDLIVSFTGPRCDYRSDKTTVVWVPAAGPSFPSGRVGLKVANVAAQAFRALAAVMLTHGYVFEETAGGTLNCRYIGGTTSTSFHAHGTAGDWNPSRNRYRRAVGTIQWGRHTDMPKAMVAAIEAIKSISGHKVWEWGGRWWNVKDPMHYELDIYRAHLTTGINLATLPAGAWQRYKQWLAGLDTGGIDMLYDLDIGKAGDPSRPDAPAHRVLQAFLVRQGQDLGPWGPNNDGVDGKPGDDTRAALHRWKIGVGITPELSAGEGRIGDYELAAIYAAGGGGGGTVDEEARNQARVARRVADDAKEGADRANASLNKIRSE